MSRIEGKIEILERNEGKIGEKDENLKANDEKSSKMRQS